MKVVTKNVNVKCYIVFVLLATQVFLMPFLCFGKQTVTGTVSRFEKFGHAVLNISIKEFNSLGFNLGDTVKVNIKDNILTMPYYDGYYAGNGECFVRAYPGHECIALCIKYGDFAAKYGIDVGDEVTITLFEEGGHLEMQEINQLFYSNDRSDFLSDESFANFREINVGNMASGRIYRSASPINNKYNRAGTVNKMIQGFDVQTIINLANSEELIYKFILADDFNSEYYKLLFENGNVLALNMTVNFNSDEFIKKVVTALTFLSERDAPYLIHCEEGKERTGFVSMLIEMIMGASIEEIVADYMYSYENYYQITKQNDPRRYQIISEENILEMLYSVAGIEKDLAQLKKLNLSSVAERYLVSNGMEIKNIEILKSKLR